LIAIVICAGRRRIPLILHTKFLGHCKSIVLSMNPPDLLANFAATPSMAINNKAVGGFSAVASTRRIWSDWPAMSAASPGDSYFGNHPN
jgi:hypothetical protein